MSDFLFSKNAINSILSPTNTSSGVQTSKTDPNQFLNLLAGVVLGDKANEIDEGTQVHPTHNDSDDPTETPTVPVWVQVGDGGTGAGGETEDPSIPGVGEQVHTTPSEPEGEETDPTIPEVGDQVGDGGETHLPTGDIGGDWTPNQTAPGGGF
ncbi:hypothetical protein A2230_02595 [candidate division WOR-1 bacterium RIFOXYA2_FULL_36_21]|uniref:Uncharacterized protein n=1 Tax=candidate division WOR-1 bacterium RIFOXYB2_FULL_36_35 TaxID=1802578 RepID=A0A1F4RZE6_UNCSA|nr:MAG: hypothetical protein A2230_02595 [candidate division WOR-1 bacterium RIFOXYA2_FULL_36_21]OGC13529.1 MAG: hypothetical protein A2290_02295 [candidate division WOR-1 bacterium RIFOXYB2_FULL_36_35]OGC16835.1 MAG: hypothetical protein A2282_02425 [candidate division WOR-1 bacterium RIFOXYA12_FULL_36_13]